MQQKKYYVAEPSQYPLVPKFNFSKSLKEKEETRNVIKLFRLEMLNKFGSGWRKIAKPQKIAIA